MVVIQPPAPAPYVGPFLIGTIVSAMSVSLARLVIPPNMPPQPLRHSQLAKLSLLGGIAQDAQEPLESLDGECLRAPQSSRR